jgi:hypothetical protein
MLSINSLATHMSEGFFFLNFFNLKIILSNNYFQDLTIPDMTKQYCYITLVDVA